MVIIGSHADAPEACSELRLEVDQEADELLGAVRAQTTSSLSRHPSGNQPVVTSDHSSQPPLHERLRKFSVGNTVNKTLPQEDIEREDLNDLAPGWELNDGFEWGPQVAGSHQVQVGLCESGRLG